MIADLQAQIEAIYADPSAVRDERTLGVLAKFRQALARGEIRAAELNGETWSCNVWVRKGLALCIRFGRLSRSLAGSSIDLDTLPVRQFTLDDRIRVTGPTCFVRDSAYVSPGCTLMPHSVIQAGAYIGADTIVDVGVGIGTCAQIGARVHLNAGVQIQGQLNPLDALPVIVGDSVSVGANCVIGAGVIISAGAVIFPGTILSRQTRLYDPLRKQRCVPGTSTPLIVPPDAIVMPGTRVVAPAQAPDFSVAIQVAIIAGYTNESELPAILIDRLLEN